MTLTLTLSDEELNALRRISAEYDFATLEDAAAAALRQYLIGAGFLEPERELDEETPTEGSR